MATARTKTDVNAGWSIDDEVIRLREWAGEQKYMLPRPPVDECLIGSADDCSLVLEDARVSRKHAQLRRERGKWTITDLASKNGLRQDGTRSDSFVIEPGVEIGIGGKTLIAESERSIALRGFCARILGWTSDRTSVIDGALRAIRLGAMHRMALVLHGRPDLVPVAHSLHRYTHGADRPFILCDRRRRKHPEESVRSVATYDVGLTALEAAAGGSLCVRNSGRPRDFEAVLLRVRDPSCRVQLILCTEKAARDADRLTQIDVPPLASRPTELDWIVQEYAHDAITALAAPPSAFVPADRTWVLGCAQTFLEIEKATLRLVALRTSASARQAAARLGMSAMALSQWVERNKPPVEVEA